MTTTQTPVPANGKQPPGQQLSPAQQKVLTLRDMLERSKNQIAMALPKHLTAERMIRVAVTAFQRTPQIQECSPLSVVSCVIQSSELGLELTGPLGQAYMVPYYNKNTKQKEAQFQIGYRGLMELAYRSGRVESFSARVVYANDQFTFNYGTHPKINHHPTMEAPGDPVAVYSVLRLRGGVFDFEVMSKAQIDAHRARYSKDTRQDSAWNTAWEEMAKKTVIRKLAKRAPVSIEVQQAAIVDEMIEAQVAPNWTVNMSQESLSPPPAGRMNLRQQPPPSLPSQETPSIPSNMDAVIDAANPGEQFEDNHHDMGDSYEGAYEGAVPPDTDELDMLEENIRSAINDASTRKELQDSAGKLMEENRGRLGSRLENMQAEFRAKYNLLGAPTKAKA